MILNKTQTEKVRQAALALLSCTDDYAMMKTSVDNLYRIFSEITGITIDQLSTDKDIMLTSGKAISSAAAAHCLLEMKRTAVFLRGINQAILSQISDTNKKPIRILYAGTGPYGTLIVPLLTLFKPDMLVVDMLDINAHSLDALAKITSTLGLNEFIEEVFCEDATTFTVNKVYDIVISETMLACLKSEPQVAIMQNLIPQLNENCVFIPQEITVDAILVNPKMEQDRMLYVIGEKPAFERHPLGNVFTVSKQNMHSILEKQTFSIAPKAAASFPLLKLFTTVKVYNNELLTENDSSITLPKQLCDLRIDQKQEVDFWYEQGDKPHIACSLAPVKYTTDIISM